MDDSGEIVFNLHNDNSADEEGEVGAHVPDHEGEPQGAEGDTSHTGGDNPTVQTFKHMQKNLVHEIHEICAETQRHLSRDIEFLRVELDHELKGLKRRMSKLEDKVENHTSTQSMAQISTSHLPANTQSGENSQPQTYELGPHNLPGAAPASTLQRGVTLTSSTSIAEPTMGSVITLTGMTNSNLREVTHMQTNTTNSTENTRSTPNTYTMYNTKGGNHRKPQLFDGNEDLDEYLAQFQIVSELNRWDYATSSMHLASSLSGPARAILSELTHEERRDYDAIVRALNNRYGSTQRAEIFRARLQTRTRGKDETIPELAQAIRKLTRQAYPCATSDLHNILALDHFIDAIPDADMRLRLRESHPKNISEAETQATRLETHKLADKQRGRLVRSVEHDNEPNVQNINSSAASQSDAVQPPEMVKTICNTIRDEFSAIRGEFRSMTQELRTMTRNMRQDSNPRQNNNRNGNGYPHNQSQHNRHSSNSNGQQGANNHYFQRNQHQHDRNGSHGNNNNRAWQNNGPSNANTYRYGQNNQGNQEMSTSGARGRQM